MSWFEMKIKIKFLLIALFSIEKEVNTLVNRYKIE